MKLTAEEIRWKYVIDLRQLVEQHLEAERQLMGVLDSFGHPWKKEPRSWFGEILEDCKLSFPASNHVHIVYPEWCGLSKTELKLFESSDVVWTYAQVMVENNRRVIELLLVDYYDQ